MKATGFLIMLLLCMILFIQNNRNAAAQKSAELHFGIGYTGVDVQGWSYGASDWGQFMGQAYAQAFPVQFSGFALGAEFGYQHFFWYVDDTYFYEHNVNAFNLMALVRSMFRENFFAELGFGVYFFEEYNDPGLSAALGYIFKINEKLSIPLKFRTGIIFDKDANLYPLGISAGLAYTF
jgi:hypothetical protein